MGGGGGVGCEVGEMLGILAIVHCDSRSVCWGQLRFLPKTCRGV